MKNVIVIMLVFIILLVPQMAFADDILDWQNHHKDLIINEYSITTSENLATMPSDIKQYDIFIIYKGPVQGDAANAFRILTISSTSGTWLNDNEFKLSGTTYYFSQRKMWGAGGVSAWGNVTSSVPLNNSTLMTNIKYANVTLIGNDDTVFFYKQVPMTPLQKVMEKANLEVIPKKMLQHGGTVLSVALVIFGILLIPQLAVRLKRY